MPQQRVSSLSHTTDSNEDWSKVTDLAERRRIQNRIAQRTYRKKLKRRLEDLEEKVRMPDGSSSPINITEEQRTRIQEVTVLPPTQAMNSNHMLTPHDSAAMYSTTTPNHNRHRSCTIGPSTSTSVTHIGGARFPIYQQPTYTGHYPAITKFIEYGNSKYQNTTQDEQAPTNPMFSTFDNGIKKAKIEECGQTA
ncbi:hypothetical protein F4824DRAFT_498921 [Ustulina deusta]|nr:hypothetical protein F4824DRAFT_498921 [Ustulina deusta]